MNRLGRIGLLALFAALLFSAPGLSQDASDSPGGENHFVLEPKEAGYSIQELLALTARETDQNIVFDPRNPILKKTVQFAESQRVSREQLFSWMQSLLSLHRVVLVPVGLSSGETWQAVDFNDPIATSRPIYIPEDEIPEWKDRAGVFVVTTIRLKKLSDSSRARNALAQLSTRAVGRINDIPGMRGFVIGDYAPVVHNMWKMLKAMDEAEQVPLDPRTGRPLAPAAAAPARTPIRLKPITGKDAKIEYYERLLAESRTETAAEYFHQRLFEIRNAK